MKKTVYNPETIGPPVGHFDRAVQFDNWLFVSGVSAMTGLTGPMNERKLEPGIERQTQLTLDNIEKVLQAAGGSLSDIYEMRVIVKEREHFPVVDRQLRERIPNKGYISHGYKGELLHPEMELEIEVYAYLGDLE